MSRGSIKGHFIEFYDRQTRAALIWISAKKDLVLGRSDLPIDLGQRFGLPATAHACRLCLAAKCALVGPGFGRRSNA